MKQNWAMPVYILTWTGDKPLGRGRDCCMRSECHPKVRTFVGKLASLRFQPGRVSSLLAVASAVKKVSSDAQIDPPLRNLGGSCSRLMSLSWSFCCMPPASVWQVSVGKPPQAIPTLWVGHLLVCTCRVLHGARCTELHRECLSE